MLPTPQSNQSKSRFNGIAATLAWVAGSAVSTVACSGDSESESGAVAGAGASGGNRGGSGGMATGGSGNPDGSADDAGGGSAAEPVYALTSNIWGDDGATGYLYTVRSLASGEWARTTITELTPEGLVRGLTVPGTPGGLVRAH